MNSFLVSGPEEMYDSEYLLAIMKKEAKRPIIEEKRKQKIIDFDLFIKWLELAKIEKRIFEKGLTLDQLMSECQKINQILPTRPVDEDLCRKITKYLAEEKPTNKADLIFVLASKSITRMQKAVELYQSGVAPLIFISGGHPFYEPEAVAESEVYRRWALEQGIPGKAMIVDSESVSVADNIRRGMNMLDDNKISFSKILFVIGWFAQKRTYMILFSHLRNDQEIYHVAPQVDQKSDISPERWYTNEFGLKIVINEFLKMRIHEYLVTNRIL